MIKYYQCTRHECGYDIESIEDMLEDYKDRWNNCAICRRECYLTFYYTRDDETDQFLDILKIQHPL